MIKTATIKAYSYLRFSTPEQSKGDSKRRQIEGAEEYAKANGLVLDEKLRDEGISAYSGANRDKGALGGFLKKVEKGLIPTGSVLIVESLDRLSRENVMARIFEKAYRTKKSKNNRHLR